MKIPRLVLMWLIVFAVGTCLCFSAAPTQFTVDGSTSWERARIERLEHQLNFTREPMPDTWDIHIISGEEFNANTNRLHLNTESAYTYLALDQTFINEDYLVVADDQRIRHTLAHEAGHLCSMSSSEQKAEAIAYILEH